MTDESASIPPRPEERCSPQTGEACVEVTARTTAGTRTIYVEHDRENGEETLRQARDHARWHGFDVDRGRDGDT